MLLESTDLEWDRQNTSQINCGEDLQSLRLRLLRLASNHWIVKAVFSVTQIVRINAGETQHRGSPVNPRPLIDAYGNLKPISPSDGKF